MKKSFAFVAALFGIMVFAGNSMAEKIPGNNSYIIIGNNDLGMHCLTSGIENFMVLPPANTFRAQVLEVSVEGSPVVVTDHNKIRVEYRVIENTDKTLKKDPHFQVWMETSEKLGFGPAVNSEGRIQSVKGTTLSGEMHANVDGDFWEVMAVPAFPDMSSNSADEQKLLIDFDGNARNPYLTAELSVFDQQTDELLASTVITVPVAYSGCINCHLEAAQAAGLPATPMGAYEFMGNKHFQGTGVNLNQIDPDGDGVPGPIRCSQCHMDPVFGSTPGYPGFPVSQRTFSEAVHGFHTQNQTVLAMNPNIANACYECHPGNDTECYRGSHGSYPNNRGNYTDNDNGHGTIWCSNCHGNLNQRVAEGQVQNPWSEETLPTCRQCHENTKGEGADSVNLGIFGEFVNGRDHYRKNILCTTCHGAPHAVYPSTLPLDNAPIEDIQGYDGTLRNCDVCHPGKGRTLRNTNFVHN